MNIDVIILSYAYNDVTTKLTKAAIESLINSEPGDLFQFNIVVIESNKKLKPFQYDHSTTLYPDFSFNFNKYLNIGISVTSNKYICLSNNDVIFHKNWASNVINAMENNNILCASTYWETYHFRERNIKPNIGNVAGYRDLFSGWCFVVKRSIFDITGLFDEHINFWYSDDDFCKTLEKAAIKNYLITNSNVTHVGGYSLDNVDKRSRIDLTIIPQLYYDYKWNNQSKFKYFIKYLWHKIKI